MKNEKIKSIVSMSASLLKPGSKIYDLKKRKYDIVAYIENSSTSEVFVQYKAFDDGMFKESYKEYADYFQKNNTVYAVLEGLNDDSINFVSTPIEYIEDGDQIYFPKENKKIVVKEIERSKDERDNYKKRRRLTYVDNNGVEVEITISDIVKIIIDTRDVTQYENNYRCQ